MQPEQSVQELSFQLTQKKKFSLWLTIVLIVFLFGVGAGYVIGTPPKEETTEIRLSDSRYRFINPLIDYQDNTVPLLNRDINVLKTEIEDIVSSAQESEKIIHASVYYRDLENGPWFSVNPDFIYRPASLLKIPLLITALKTAESQPDFLKREVLYEKAF